MVELVDDGLVVLDGFVQVELEVALRDFQVDCDCVDKNFL